MSALATQKVGSAPSFTPPPGAGATFKPDPSGMAKSDAVLARVQAIKASTVAKSATAVLADIKKIIDDELAFGNAYMKDHDNKLPEGGTLYTFTDMAAKKMFIYPLRCDYLKKTHSAEIKEMSAAQERCFNAIVNLCIEKLKGEPGTASILCWVERIRSGGIEALSASQILRSKVRGVLNDIPVPIINLF